MGQFIDLKINVNGTIHNVKVERNVSLGMDYSGESNWASKDGKWGTYENLWEKAKLRYQNDLKMSEAQFSIFKNIADNQKENGNEIILSKADIEKAQELYYQGNFTADISKNLPAGYRASKYDQIYPDHESVYPLVRDKDNNEVRMWLSYDAGEDEILTEIIKNRSIEGTVKYGIVGDGDYTPEYTFTDKQGREIHMTDKDIYYITYKTQDGKTVTEYYHGSVENDPFTPKENPSSKSIDYVTSDNKKVHEYYYENGNFYKELSYVQNGKKYEEKYEGGNHLTFKKVTYKNRAGYDVDERYDTNNKLESRQVSGNGTFYTEYFKNGQLTLRSTNIGNNVYRNETRWGTYVTNSNNLSKIGNFDVTANSQISLSEKAKKAQKEYRGKSNKEIAEALKGQIDGPSFNDNTFAMFDGIPKDKLIDVLKEYKKTGGIWFGNKAGFFEDLNDEWGVSDNEILSRMKYAYAIYLKSKDTSALTQKDMEIANKLQSFNQSNGNLDELVKEVDKQITN